MKKQKTGGRIAGTPNKTTKDLRAWVTAFIEANTSQIEADWQSLEPKERMQFFEKMMKYALPQLQAVSNTIEFEKMTDDQLDEIFERLLKTASNED